MRWSLELSVDVVAMVDELRLADGHFVRIVLEKIIVQLLSHRLKPSQSWHRSTPWRSNAICAPTPPGASLRDCYARVWFVSRT